MIRRLVTTASAALLLGLAWPAPAGAAAGKERTAGLGVEFSIGASIPKGDLWGVEPRASLGFGLSAGARLVFGHSCTEPSIFFLPQLIDTGNDGIANGSLLPLMIGMQIYPYNVLFVRPYFMLGVGWAWARYSGPYPLVPTLEQSGTGQGVSLMAGAGVDFSFSKMFSVGPVFHWNPVYWLDCTKKVEMSAQATLCNAAEDRWRLRAWFVGVRVAFGLDRAY
jgi:hypothetical protein